MSDTARHSSPPGGGRSFFVQNFGCRATQSDGAAIAAELSRRGLAEVRERREADFVVVNTCTVTAEADRDARQTVRRIHRENPAAEILVTGCYAQRRPQDIEKLPGVKWVVGNSHKPAIGEIVSTPLVPLAGLESPSGFEYHGEIQRGGTLVSDIAEQRRFLGAPVVDAGADRTRPNLKVQDGCHNRCTFCIIPSVRGGSRSAPIESVVAQARDLARRYPEIVLTGINLGRWGRDLPGRPRFPALLRALLAETPARKLRISSIEPMDWTAELLELVASNERVCKHVHIPLQSASDPILKAMRRRYRARHYAGRVALARRLMPQASIGADVMVGFPGETEEDFEQTRRFIAEGPFTYLHVFTYSARPGTPAAEMPEPVPMPVRKRRNQILRELIAAKNLEFRRSLAGQSFDAVTLDSHENGARAALTGNYVRVRLEGPDPGPGQLVKVRIAEASAAETRALLCE